jgi:hypothetical protein
MDGRRYVLQAAERHLELFDETTIGGNGRRLNPHFGQTSHRRVRAAAERNMRLAVSIYRK